MKGLLHIATGSKSRQVVEFDIDALPITVGRAPDNDVILPYLGVSRRHCRIDTTGGVAGLRVQDVGSKQGTALNGAPVVISTLRSGDVLRVGPVVVRFEVADGAAREGPSGDFVSDSKLNAETGRLEAVRIRASCEMCSGPVTEKDLLVGGRMLADDRALCPACVAHLGSARTFGGLVLLRTLGEGTFGTVLKALHTTRNVIVAVKTLKGGADSSPEEVARILREINVGKRLDHAAIVGPREAMTDGETFYLVMDYIEGKDLYARVAENAIALSFAELARVARRLAAALDHAHDHGIVHRDVKPKNVLLDAKGDAYLTDFGLARVIEASPRLHRTGAGKGIGTPLYMAPEQFTDARGAESPADVYGLAATLFFAVTGRAPHTGATVGEIQRKITTQPPPLANVIRPDMPAEAARALAMGLARDPRARPARAGALVDAIIAGLDRRSGPLDGGK